MTVFFDTGGGDIYGGPSREPVPTGDDYLQGALVLLKQSVNDSVINQNIIEVLEISERILAEAVKRSCDKSGLAQYTVDQILRDTHRQAVAEWQSKTHREFA